MRVKRILIAVPIVLFVFVFGFLLLAPTKADPESWNAGASPGFEGAYKPTASLASVEWLARGKVAGPEGLAFDAAGNLYSGLADGRIVRIDPASQSVTTIANTGGRPLGIVLGPDGKSVIVGDAYKGLLSVSFDGTVKVLTTGPERKKFGFANTPFVATDGMIYVTDSSDKWNVADPEMDVIEHRPRGRIFAFDPSTGSLSLLADGLYFANGIAGTPDGNALLVAETSSYRVRRIGLKGPDRGKVTTFVEQLPGFPDNLSIDDRGTVWVALFAPRDPLVDKLSGSPFVRKMIARLPKAARPKAKSHAIALGFDANGKLVHSLQHEGSDAYAPLTEAEANGEWLYFGSLTRDAVARTKRP